MSNQDGYIKIMVSIRTKKVGSECMDEIEIDRDEWESMTDQEREECAMECMWNMAEWNWEVV